jgi:hypothetical protein
METKVSWSVKFFNCPLKMLVVAGSGRCCEISRINGCGVIDGYGNGICYGTNLRKKIQRCLNL